jgi:DNA polymerase-1
MSLRTIHDFELALLDPCLAMSSQGIPVDEARRAAMLADLDAMRAPLLDEVRTIVLPRLAAAKRLPKPHLFRALWTCPCCRGGAAKVAACWSCAGFATKPGKRALSASGRTLAPCRVCAGEGKRSTLAFNPNSPEQVGIVLYDVLRLPQRVKGSKPTVDEEALKSLRPYDALGVVERLLTVTKAGTMRAILERIAPAPDGRIRTFYNPAGTETGRFSSSESFLVPSTNLQNLPKREAATDPRFEVRACLVPDEGCVLVEADLSGAEAWVTMALVGDHETLDRMRRGEDIHAWTAMHLYELPSLAAVTPTYRVMGKTARHALDRGMQWKKFMSEVNSMADRTGLSVTPSEAQRIVAAYHRLHPLLVPWWRKVQDELSRTHRLTTCFGRTRTFFDRGQETWLSSVHLDALAYVPQSTVGDLLNRGLLRWWRQHDGKLGDVRMQVHDSVVLVVPRAKAPLAAARLRAALTEPITVNGITLTIPVDVTVGERWNAMEGVR